MAIKKLYDLEERTLLFAKRCRDFINKLPKTTTNRIKISRKESKESRFWLRLCDTGENQKLLREQQELIQESTEYIKIFTSILKKSV